jgi:hypothetical protein
MKDYILEHYFVRPITSRVVFLNIKHLSLLLFVIKTASVSRKGKHGQIGRPCAKYFFILSIFEVT